MTFRELYQSDRIRSADGLTGWEKRFHYLLRKTSTCKNRFLLPIYRALYKIVRQKHGIEISYDTQIGKGLYLGHPYNITVNPRAVIGDNVSIHKGVVIGEEKRGKRKGTPVIGNCVWIGINVAIVGSVKIGNDVLIAPNSYVNSDVPDHSVVFGNPCIIKHRENATEGYVNRRV